MLTHTCLLGGGAGGGSSNSNRADGQSVHSYEEIAASEVASLCLRLFRKNFVFFLECGGV